MLGHLYNRGARGLLLAAALLGCSTGTSTPLGLESDKGGNRPGGKEPPTPVTLALAGAMVANPQEVQVVASNRNKLELNLGGVASYVLATGFANAGNCTIEPEGADPTALLAKLVDGFGGGRHLTLKIDKRSNGSPSAGHLLATTWTDADGLVFSAWISEAAVSWENGSDVYAFVGGSVKVKHDPGDPSGRTTITCDNGDAAVAQVEGL